MIKKFLWLVIIALIAGAALTLWAFNQYDSPADYTETKHIIITKGSGTKRIMHQLAAEGMIEYPFATAIISKYQGDGDLRYGEYLFEPGLSPKQIIEKIKSGAVVIRKITIPEGKTSFEIMEILGDAEGLAGSIPDIAEGSILPQTYLYQYGNTYSEVIKRMQQDMQNNLQRLWEFRRMDTPLKTPEEALVLASIVEKETGIDGERGLVASVFTNRLRIGMPLQSDPTAIYGITGGAPLGRMPLSADMKHQSAFNTYVNKGLPPTPICHPGIAAIEAVLNPPDSSYLYFVADGKGGHNFSGSLKAHNNNINSYRKVQKAQKSAPPTSKKNIRMKSNMIIRP